MVSIPPTKSPLQPYQILKMFLGMPRPKGKLGKREVCRHLVALAPATSHASSPPLGIFLPALLVSLGFMSFPVPTASQPCQKSKKMASDGFLHYQEVWALDSVFFLFVCF